MNLMDMITRLFRMINNLSNEYIFLNPLMILITKYMVYVLIAFLLYCLFSRKKQDKLIVLYAVLAFALAEILARLAGMFHSNMQPFVELPDVNPLIEKTVGNSFPSDHTILFFSVCITFFLFKKKFSVLWIVIAFVVGLSRIWVGVHYPGDVLAGALLGTLAAIVIYRFIPKNYLLNKLLKEKGTDQQLISENQSNFLNRTM